MAASQPAVQTSGKPPAFAYMFLFVIGLMVSGIIKEAHDSAVESKQREVLRVTSPDGRLDAVFVRPIFSFLGYGSALYIVLKGESAPGWGHWFTARLSMNLPS